MLTSKNSIPFFFAALFVNLFSGVVFAQSSSNTDDPLLKIYRETPAKINDLVHTKLEVSFDYKKCYLYGKEWLTLKPHFYPTDTLRLDAKGMDLKTIAVVKDGKNIPLKFTYDSLTVAIQLDKVYQNNEKYTLYISYTSKPNELKTKGSAAINDAKGLYFINPDGADKDKPIQIWTQGESESSSAWFPTIDKPEQKTTEEIIMTVPAKYVTLSNGRLASQKDNNDGTRTDTWKMELPHSPYLFMMAVGDFKIYHDKWHDKEVNYYLEPKYAPFAKEIFGTTPEMIDFYSKTLGVDFPWNKYSQIVVRDYVSGAMENTTATLHGDYVQATARELLDANYDDGRSTVAHELFHQWFGDLVTCESWSNLTVNESFADFSEMLWAEHKYGKDEADAHSFTALQNYLATPDANKKNLVRFHYADKEDVFDVVTYQKGGRVLNMLRNYLGYDAFYKGLNIYLKTNAFKTGEAQQLRLALEEASGLDLNWFFNQWYYGAGHPELTINYSWDDAKKTELVYIKQTQDGQIFKIPMAIDIYAGGKKERHKVWLNGKSDTLTFSLTTKPDLVNVDADKVLLTQKTDNKSLEEFVFQYFNAPLYLDRFEAINAAAARQSDKDAQKVMLAALKDKYYGLRIKAISSIHLSDEDIKKAALPVLDSLAKNDSNTLVQAASINALGRLRLTEKTELYKQALKNQSYAVEGAALGALASLDTEQALKLASGLENDSKGGLTVEILKLYVKNGSTKYWPFVYNQFKDIPLQEKINLIGNFGHMIGDLDKSEYVQQGVNTLKDIGIKYKANGAGPVVVELLNNIKQQRTNLNDTIDIKFTDDAIKAVNDAK